MSNRQSLKSILIVSVLVAVLGHPCVSETNPVTPDRTGKVVADFQLKTHRGGEFDLAKVEQPIVVLAFLGTECPLVKLYGPRLNELQNEFADRGVAIFGINANTQDSVTDIDGYMARHGISFPILKDTANRIADQLGAERTPEVFLLDKERRIRYHGRIDDQYLVGLSREEPKRRDLAEAINELLDGKSVSVASTEVVGCHIGRVSKVEPTGDITYTKHIAQIFNKRCVECHRDGEIAPFTLTSYDDVIGWEDTIVEVIEDKRMPPWFANPDHGKFHNDARLSDEEKELIFTWVENGMPQGDPTDMPPPPTFVKGWRIPKPDQIIHCSEQPVFVKAQGVIDYKYFEIDPGWTEDKYITAAEARPGTSSVVHHIIAYVRPPGTEEFDFKHAQMVVGYAPGSDPTLLRNGVAMRVPAGSKLLFEMHYTPNGSEQTDHSYIGIKFTDKSKVTKELRGGVAIQPEFEIPPHADNHEVVAYYRSKRDELLLDMTPHMHLRGKAFRYEAIYPNGSKEVLLDLPRYDFNWQLSYELAEPKLLPKGTVIRCTGWYDNSTKNPVNPEPNKPVRWGRQSWEEMMIGFFTTVDADQAADAARKSNGTIVR
ncbi:MAG: redoxin domain-containing protein [Planctomycetales bacterium]|nr:redoxin domain-containing protein [Planctomycetales bacterium]